jgi:outer membrane protein OmpA-like peptidoglycan-associated protein
MTVEGRHTRIIYAAPESRSTFEVFDNYRRALAEAGFETLFTCAGHACGERALLATHILYAPDRRLRTLGPLTEFAFSFPLQPYYLSARLPGVEGETGADDIYISIYVARENFDAFPETQNRALILLDVIEPAQLEDRIDPNGNIDADGSAGADIGATASTAESTPDPGGGSTIVPSAVAAETPVDAHDAAGMEAALREHGRVAIYAIHFASGSAELTQDSYPIVSEIASVLGRNPDLNLFVVGHSDIEGGYQLNMTLSQQRAEAIVRALVEREFIPADRLQAASVGMLVPVASNATEAGRALNRRVELVVR